jgi:RNA polymerase sigma factor (TIGR02999 family)
MNEVTRILTAIEQGDPLAPGQLLPLLYDELRKLAAQKLAQEAPGQTLQPTALVHEAYLRLVGGDEGQHWNSRGHFFAAAAEAMRRILVESARRRGRQKRGGDWQRCDILAHEPAVADPEEEVLAVHEALDQFATKHPDKAELVKLRYFAGLTLVEAAAALQISTATAERRWRYARAWLARRLRGSVPEEEQNQHDSENS